MCNSEILQSCQAGMGQSCAADYWRLVGTCLRYLVFRLYFTPQISMVFLKWSVVKLAPSPVQ